MHLVVGCKEDKHWQGLLEPLLPYCRAVYATRPPTEKTVDPQEMVQLAAQSGRAAVAYAEPQAALEAAQAACAVDDIVVVAGSLFLVARARELVLPQAGLLSLFAETDG